VTDIPIPHATVAEAHSPDSSVTSKASNDTNPPSDLSLGLDLTNATQKVTSPELLAHYQKLLEEARHRRYQRQSGEAQPILVELLAEESPEQFKQAALLELAMVAQDQNNGTRAEQVYAQFRNKWPNDPRVPEILLREGQIFRQLGLNTLALTKFYAVMTSALVLKNEKLGYYQKIVLQAQIEIAETHYLLGKYPEAADFYGRLLKQNSPELNRPQVQYRLVRSFAAVGRNDEVVSQSQDFLARYPDASEQPEVRFYLAQALKQLGRNSESLQQVLTLLQEQKSRTKEFPGLWSYWQQRAGNEIANQFYRESDYAKALEIYLNLAELDPSPAWKLPVSYQIGMTYERLTQPVKAIETYQEILSKQTEAGTNSSPGLKAVFEMAQWRVKYLQWHDKAETVNRSLLIPGSTNAVSVAKAGGGL
jgi:tetratricopeptide (TPR) repeat protein